MEKTSRKRRKSGSFSPWLFLLPAIIVFLLTKYYPIVQSIFITFFKFDIMNPPGKFVGLANYVEVFKDPNIQQDLGNMVWYFVIIMLINFWPPILLAIMVNELRGGKTFFRSLYFIPAIAPGIAIQLIWKYIWQPDYGFMNQVLGILHLPNEFLWLNSEAMVKWCLFIPGLVTAGGMSFVIYLAALQDIPQELYEASFIDGSGIIARVKNITIPLMKPVLEVMFVLTIINVVNLINEPLVMTQGGPGGASETLSLYAFKKATRDLEYGYSLTISTVVFILAFIFTSVQMKISSGNGKEG